VLVVPDQDRAGVFDPQWSGLAKASPPISLDLSRSVESNQHHGAPNAEERRAVEASRGILVKS